MKHLMENNRVIISRMSLKSFFAEVIVMMITIFLIVYSAWASQYDLFGPPSDFLNSKVAIKTETGTHNLSMRLVEFLIGIQTDKSWERRSDTFWILRTGFKDPVTEMYKSYVLEFEKLDNVVVLTAVSFDNRMLSRPEIRSFAEQIMNNFGKHVSPK